MGISRSTKTPARDAARQRLKTDPLRHQWGAEAELLKPTSSWWVGLDRADFYRRAAFELRRMRRSTMSVAVSGGVSVGRLPGTSRPSVADAGDTDPQPLKPREEGSVSV